MEFFRVSLDVIWKLSVQHPYLGYNTEFSAQLPIEQRPKKLLKQVQDVIRLKHYSYQTGKTYIYWIRRYILFHNNRHPKDMGSKEIEEFLTHLAIN